MPTEFVYKYPGDPPCVAVVLTGAEFKQRFPDRFTTVVGHMLSATFKHEQVLCDGCGDIIREEHTCYLVHRETWLYCSPCAKRYILPHKQGEAQDPEAS